MMRFNTMLHPRILWSTLLGTAGGLLGAAYYISSRINPIPRPHYSNHYTFTPWELGVPFESLTLQTEDGPRLSAWWMPYPESETVIIGCHGHIGAKPDLLGIGTGSWRAGHNVLLFDFRGRGASDPWPNTLISQEVRDLLTAVDYVKTRMPGAPIGVVGFSMGASVALLAAAGEPAIRAVVADSPFASATEVVTHSIHSTLRFALPTGPLLALADLIGERRFGYRLHNVRPLHAVPQIAPRPLLLIHGTADSIIPVDHGTRIFEAAGQPRELWLYPGVDHCGAYFADRPGYVARVTDFFAQYLRN
jgi:uncharacterized protein